MKDHKHIFSIFFENLSDLILNLKSGQIFELKNKTLYQRLIKVLRLKTNNHFILFDKNLNVEFSLGSKIFFKDEIIFPTILKINQNKSFKPEIIFCPALLKRSSFEQVIYIAAQMGVDVIQPVITEKIQKKWWSEKEKNRLYKIMISACEQSKNFIIPQLIDPALLKDFSKLQINAKKVFFDMNGKNIFNLLQDLNNKKVDKIILMFGPEGGLTDQELNLLKSYSFEFFALTPTILKSVQAVAAGLAIVRSI